MSALSKEALGLLKAYEGMPYFNNSRAQLRTGLRAQVGKGTPKEITEEGQLAAFRKHVNLASLASENRKKFLIDHKLGIDCSGFAYHILDTESRARGLGPLRKHLHFPFAHSSLKRLGRWLRQRYVENTDVRTFAHPSNSHKVKPRDIESGDFFVRLKNGDKMTDRDHMILVIAVNKEDNPPDKLTITLSQSEARPEDGRYGHGVRIETIPVFALPQIPLHRLNWF